MAVARAAQEARSLAAGAERPTVNARLDGRLMERTGAPDEAGRALMIRAAEAQGLTARGWVRTLRVARTIADLDGSTGVRRIHVAEALSYRRPGVEPVGSAGEARAGSRASAAMLG